MHRTALMFATQIKATYFYVREAVNILTQPISESSGVGKNKCHSDEMLKN